MNNRKKVFTFLISSVFFGFSVSSNYTAVINKTEAEYFEEEWKTVYGYSPWVDDGTAYNCNVVFDDRGDAVFRIETCDQDQTRTYDEYLEEIHNGNRKLVQKGAEESQTIELEEEEEVGSIEITSDSFNILEGDSDQETNFDVTVKLNKSFTEVVEYSYNTQDITTSSVLHSAENLVYDQYGNPFISVVDNESTGRLIFDGGFPKYFNENWSETTTFNGMNPQFKFMHNIIKWISETHSDRGKVLLYGDAIEGHNYAVKATDNAGTDFNISIPNTISIAGYTPVTKDAAHADFGGGSKSSDKKAVITLEELNKYSSVIIISSGGWESLSSESANNFTTYVNNGGGVYIITDHDYFQMTGNQILRKFGSEFYGSVNRTLNHTAYNMSTIWSSLSGTEYDQSHDLWYGMSSSDSLLVGISEGNVRLFTPQKDIEAKSGFVTFSPGETEKTITLTVNGDDLSEDDETFRLMIQGNNEKSYILPSESSKVFTINDDD